MTTSIDSPDSAPEASKRSPAKTALYVVVGLAALVGLFFLGRYLGDYIPRFAQWVDGLGFWGPVVFILGYALATVLLAPGSLLTLAGGAIFGIVEGTIYVFLGASLGACLAFLVSRYLARGMVEKRVAGNKKFAALDKAVGGQGLKITFLLRLVPLLPFNLTNYGLGLTKVKFRDYAIACLGMIPGTLLYVYYGKLAGEVASAVGGAEVERGPEYWIFLALGLIATIAVTTVITKTAKKALDQATDLDEADDDETKDTSHE